MFALGETAVLRLSGGVAVTGLQPEGTWKPSVGFREFGRWLTCRVSRGLTDLNHHIAPT